MCDNLQKCCRVCLDVEADHVSILEDPGIQLHLKSCLGITIYTDTHLPQSICFSCVAQLNDFYNFQMNARCSQDWIQSCVQEKSKKASETKTPIQPLPDSEYNSDSLLEFLNNTANIDEYLSNLGKEDIPAIVNMLDRNNENSVDMVDKLTNNLKLKLPSPKKRQVAAKTKNCHISMQIDVLDSEKEIVKEILLKEVEPKTKARGPDTEIIQGILLKEVEPKTKVRKKEKALNCFSCKAVVETVQKLAEHLSICDTAQRTCLTCNILFDSKHRMVQHRLTHITGFPATCNCRKVFTSKEQLAVHYKICLPDYTAGLGCSYNCKQCGTTFTDRQQLYKHAKEHLKAKKICTICGDNFDAEAALEAHMKDHYNPENISYRCKVCSYTNKDRKEVYQHVMKHSRLPPPQRHLCDSCGKSFTSSSTLKRHLTMHNGKSKQKNHSVISKAEKQTCDGDNIMCEHCGETIENAMLNLHTCVGKYKE